MHGDAGSSKDKQQNDHEHDAGSVPGGFEDTGGVLVPDQNEVRREFGNEFIECSALGTDPVPGHSRVFA